MSVADTDALFDRVTRLAQLLPNVDDIDDPDDIDADFLLMIATEMTTAVGLALRALRQS